MRPFGYELKTRENLPYEKDEIEDSSYFTLLMIIVTFFILSLIGFIISVNGWKY